MAHLLTHRVVTQDENRQPSSVTSGTDGTASHPPCLQYGPGSSCRPRLQRQLFPGPLSRFRRGTPVDPHHRHSVSLPWRANEGIIPLSIYCHALGWPRGDRCEEGLSAVSCLKMKFPVMSQSLLVKIIDENIRLLQCYCIPSWIGFQPVGQPSSHGAGQTPV